jgi:hypothetical protein
MANGKPGDHPLTNIVLHNLDVYGGGADELIRRIAELCSRRELDEWWNREVGSSPDTNLIIAKARSRLDELLDRAKQGGWEAGFK